MQELLVSILTFTAIMAIGAAVLMRRSRAQLQLDQRLSQLADQDQPAAVAPDRGSSILARIGRSLSAGRISAALQQELAQAGFHNRLAAPVYLGAKIVLLVTGVVLASLLSLPLQWPATQRLLLIVAAAAALSYLPNLILRQRRNQRQTQVRHHLPDAVDLLEICVSSGMGLDMAWNAVTDEIRRVSPVLADEMALTNLEMHLGAPRAQAMRHMAQRTGADDLASLAAVLVQSDRFGTSVADALRTFAVSMREIRSQRAEEAAEKMAVKLLFPMVIFIFPVIILVAAGPAGIRVVQLLGI